ncbi:myeloid leukemia factor 1 isoform X5 [Rhinoderma darwinii]|uniref:myeloid leukemia factor 1 isoform X5 n=1 Tax=Rhinoderma darwinii TaxID=43563 RepID=UPI003F67AF5D
MFGSLLRDFEEDPFFSDPFTAHQEHVRQMMRSFSDPFGRDPFFSITDGRSHGRRGQQGSQVALREDHRASSLCHMPSAPFSSMVPDFKDGFQSIDNMMANMRNRMIDIHKQFIKETKEAVKDSESGVEQIAVGHHIKDRAHIVKQLKNNKTGDEELNQEFLNMDESDAPSFDSEWDREISKFKPYEKKFSIEAPKHQKAQYSTKIRPPGVPRRERCISKMVI